MISFGCMRALFVVLLVAMSMAVTASAQWIKQPTPGVPRLPNGAVNLNAPTPKLSGGHPDFSGLWTGATLLGDPACAGKPGCIGQEPIPVQAIHIGLVSPDQFQRLRSGGMNPLELLPYQAWAADLVKRRSAFNQGVAPRGDDDSIVDQHARCMPPNYPRAWALPQYRRIVQAADRLVVLHEFNASYRQIFTDARPLPADPTPSWQGYSSGRWQGDTLVVETIGFRDDLWLDLAGSPMTNAARVTERIRRPRYGSLEIEVIVNDPKAYTRPWTVRLDQAIVVDTELLDDNCMENEQSVRRMIGK
jgi:hypothetical protein